MNKQQHADPENIIKALNQLSQTIEAMAIVINRLKRSVENGANKATAAQQDNGLQSDRKLH